MGLQNERVLISGGGIAGFTLAYWLKVYGFEPTIVESAPSLRTGGYKIDVRGAAIEVIERMGVKSQVFESKTEIRQATIISGDGRREEKMDADRCGGRVEGDLEIMRGDLCQIVAQVAKGVECLFGDEIEHLVQREEGVDVTFKSGQTRTFDLVIGADGLHSKVRRLVFGEEALFLKPLGVYLAVYTAPNFLGLEKSEIEFFGDQRFINVYSLGKGGDMKVGFAFGSTPLQFDPNSVKQQKELLEESFGSAGWEAPKLLESMKDTHDFYFDVAAQILMPAWSGGRVALVGDAGYAVSPLSGQGTSVALVGAYVLAGELAQARGDHKEAFSQYEKTMRPFVKKNQELVELSVAMMKGESWFVSLTTYLKEIFPDTCANILKGWGTTRIYEAAQSFKLKEYSGESSS